MTRDALADKLMALRSALNPTKHQFAWDEMTRIAEEIRKLPPVPDGYVLMPSEATRTMTMAGCDSLPSCEHVFGHAGEMLKNAYRKMVDVAALHSKTRGTDSK